MRSKSLDLPLLLWALSWNVQDLIASPIAKYERTALMVSDELPDLLTKWHKSPRGHNQGIKTKGALQATTQFALDVVGQVVNKEMGAIGQLMRCSTEDLSEEELLAINWEDLKQAVRTRAPTIWSLLHRCAWVKKQQRNTMKDPNSIILYMISMASYSRSNRNNLCQRLIAIYLKSCGTAAKAFDTLHALGITMSQKWTYRGLEALSQNAHDSLLRDMDLHPYFLSHDNLNMKFRVFEQRSDHQSHFDSGTAGTVFIIKNPSAVRPSNPAFQARRAIGSKNPLNAMDILKLEMQAAPRLASRAIDVSFSTF
ncbi:hypothetical protein A0H81_08665 [Grifola frondosa]|uniref:Uncharacterized protein n=1 Tax=Grifola frondosa TaxID=5627 RepID=A0A1C7M3C7_GRIFR|nr:hypothetical protein A0H81_08665 [Grifola frondosa]